MRLALISVMGLLVGCGGDDAISIAANQDNFCDQIADVVCHNMYQCCTEHEIESRLGVSDPRTELQCRDDYAKACERNAPGVRDSLKAGRVTFDAQKLNDCLNAVVAPSDTCSTIVDDYPWKEACKDAPWVGAVQTGGTCFFDFDCAGGQDSFCGPDQKCKMKPTAGFPCSSSNPCASAYYCGTGGTCTAKLAAGAPCTAANQCDKDLFCDFNAMPMPVCAAKQAGGAACSSNLGCESGECVPGQCMGTTTTCYTDAQCGSHCANSSASCTTASQCALGNCSVSGFSCSSNTSCTGGTGDMCVFPVQCVPGDCVGDPVCTAPQYTADYCTATGNVPQP